VDIGPGGASRLAGTKTITDKGEGIPVTGVHLNLWPKRISRPPVSIWTYGSIDTKSTEPTHYRV